MDPVQLDHHDDVRRLLEAAVADVQDTRPPIEPLLQRRRRDRRGAGLRAGALLCAAAVAVSVAVAITGNPWDRATVVDPAASDRVTEYVAAGDVAIGLTEVGIPEGWRLDKSGGCAGPETVVLQEQGVDAPESGTDPAGCGTGPAVVLSGRWDPSWRDDDAFGLGAGGARSDSSLEVVKDNVPVWLDEGAAGQDDPDGRSVILAPYNRTRVTLIGTSLQRSALMQLVEHRLPGGTQPTFGGQPDESGVRVSVSGRRGPIETEPALGKAVVQGLREAPAVRFDPADPPCAPSGRNTVVVDVPSKRLSAAARSGAPGPGDRTSFVLDRTGSCRLAWSSTGATVDLDDAVLAVVADVL